MLLDNINYLKNTYIEKICKMEEIQQIQAQNYDENKTYVSGSSLHMSLKAVLQSTQFRCIKNNMGMNICSNQNCEKAGLMCGEWKCECQNSHKKCKSVLFWRVIESILSKKQNLPQNVKQSYEALSRNINKIIEELSELRFNFQSQQQYFGLFKSQLKFVNLVKENKVDQISGKLINQMQNTFEVQVQFDMLSKDHIEKDFQQKRKQFSKLCKQIESKYSKKQRLAEDLFLNSSVLINNQHKIVLAKWIKQTSDNSDTKNILSKLLFRASQHQFLSQKFYQYCGGKKDTLVVVRNEFGKTFGGFTHSIWEKNNTQNKFITDNTKKSFLFSLDENIKIPCNNHQQSIRCYQGYGPLFGQDLGLSNKANLNKILSFSPFNSYKITLVDKKYQKNQQIYALLTGDSSGKYKVTQYQVYQIQGLNLQ